MEKTLVIIKPDAVEKKYAGDIIKFFYEHGINLVALKMLRPSRQNIEDFYSVHKDKEFFNPLVEFMISGPIIVCVLQAENVILKVRRIIGATDSKKAESGTIRNLFGTDGRRNAVHASDCLENALKETAFFFKKEEIY